MVALQLMDEEGVDGRDVEDLDRQPPDLRHVEDLERRPLDLKLIKGPDSQEPSRPRTLPNPSVATTSRPPVAAAKGSTVVAAALKPKNGVPKEKAILTRQRVTKTKKNDGRPPVSPTSTLRGAALGRRPLVCPDPARGPARTGHNLIQSAVNLNCKQ